MFRVLAGTNGKDNILYRLRERVGDDAEELPSGGNSVWVQGGRETLRDGGAKVFEPQERYPLGGDGCKAALSSC